MKQKLIKNNIHDIPERGQFAFAVQRRGIVANRPVLMRLILAELNESMGDLENRLAYFWKTKRFVKRGGKSGT